jgi:hypothetical protein
VLLHLLKKPFDADKGQKDRLVVFQIGDKFAEIVLGADAQGDRISLSVADHGPGISDADRGRVVERFVRLEQSRSLPGQGFAWKGFALGRFNRVLRPNPRLRCLMPPVERLRQQGLPCLDLDDPQPVLGLLAGQSLPVDSPVREIGLYFRGLPLCRLTVKGKRALLR